MSGVDIILSSVILFGIYKGYKEGFLMSLIKMLAIVLGVIGGFKLTASTMGLLTGKFNIGNGALPYISFGIVFIIIIIAVSIVGRSIKASMDKNFLGRVDEAAGAALGLAKVVFTLSVMIWLLGSLQISLHHRWIEDSWLYPKIALVAPKITALIAKAVPNVKNVF